MDSQDFCIRNEMENADVNLQIVGTAANTLTLEFTVHFKEKTPPSPVRVEWKVPVGNILSVWSPLAGFSRALAPDWKRFKSESKTAVGAPVLSLVNCDGTNACTVAVSDPSTPMEIGAGISEETAEFFCNIVFFTSYVSPIEVYKAEIRLDFEKIPLFDTVRNVRQWWEKKCGYRQAYVPADAYLPVDSTWYSFHQQLNSAELEAECRLASALGMKTLIIDDGWQTEDNRRGYAYCGDWDLSTGKIPDMKALTDRIHQLGMKVMLWYSVPFVGVCSKAYERFRGMALTEERGVLTLDLRYREVRDYLVGVYTDAVRKFGLDGLKLDFIDRFVVSGQTPESNEKMDYESIEDALNALLTQVKGALLKINPEILLEFRQKYMGPAVLKYGNMVRVSDCPFDSMRNRAEILNLRMTSGKAAVHSDMIMWNRESPVEAVARQLISTLFGVPQISVRLKECPREHLEAISFWLNFYKEHTELLHSDDLSVKNPELFYTQAKVCKDGSVIGVNYAAVPFSVDPFRRDSAKYELINSSDESFVAINASAPLGTCVVRILDCLGKPVSESRQVIEKGMQMFPVPVCGLVEILKA